MDKNIIIASVRLLSTLLCLILPIMPYQVLAKSQLYNVSLQIPFGVFENKVFVTPNSTVLGLLTVESLTNEELSCKLVMKIRNCTLLTNNVFNFNLKLKHDLRAFNVKVKVLNSVCIIKATINCNNVVMSITRFLIPRHVWNLSFEFIIPSDTLCRVDPKYEKFVIIAKPSNVPTFLRFITGKHEVGHPDLITLACLKIYGPEYYTVVLIFKSLDGKLLPISSSSLELTQGEGEERYGIITLTGVKGEIVFPLFTPKYPESLIGRHVVEVYVYPYGSSKPILNKTYMIKIISTRGEAIYLTFFAGLVAVPVFLVTVTQYLRKSHLRDVILCALLGCLTFITVTIPGQVLWGIGAILGPFDWLIHGLAFDVLLYMLYTISVLLRPKFGTLTMVMFIKWIMYSLFFGRLSIISMLWLATSALFFEPLLYITGVTRGKISLPSLLISFTLAGLVDRYVDLMLYMALYRLYYANWYVFIYVIGNTLYTIPGIVMGYSLSRYLRGVLHE